LRIGECAELLKCQLDSCEYSHIPYMIKLASYLNMIMPTVAERKCLLFDRYKLEHTKSVKADNNPIRQASRANANNREIQLVTWQYDELTRGGPVPAHIQHINGTLFLYESSVMYYDFVYHYYLLYTTVLYWLISFSFLHRNFYTIGINMYFLGSIGTYVLLSFMETQIYYAIFRIF